MRPLPELREAVRGLALDTQGGWAYRAVDARFPDSINSVVGSLRGHGRFHHRDDELGVLYLGLNREALLHEVTSRAQEIFLPHLLPPPTHAVAPFLVQLGRVLDTTDPHVQDVLGTSAQELSGSWTHENHVYGRVAPTQLLARAAFLEGVEAIRFLSGRTPSLVNLAVFVRHVAVPLRATLPEGGVPQRVPDAQSTPELRGGPRLPPSDAT